MTVKELKKMLDRLPDDMEVYHSRDAYSYPQAIVFCGKQTAYRGKITNFLDFQLGGEDEKWYDEFKVVRIS